MELSFAAATDLGRKRTRNEDNFLIDPDLRLFVVADGMGGHAAGEIASSITVHEIRSEVSAQHDLIARYRIDQAEVRAEEVLEILDRAIQRASSAVHVRAQAEPDKRGMGTTATVLLIAGTRDHLRGFIAHVGDSRVYLARQNQCHVLTEDHSLSNELLRRGGHEPIGVSALHQYKNAVTRAVGVYSSVEVDTFDFDILPGDRFLICSDGLYAYLDETELPDQLAELEINAVPEVLIARANAAGGHDNITAVVIRVDDSNLSARSAQRNVEVTQKLDVLRGMQMFRYLSYKELAHVAAITQTVEFQPNETVFSAGEPGDAMYVVVSGTVTLVSIDVTVAELGPGQHFGEMSLVDHCARSLTAIASGSEGTRLVAIQRKDVYDVLKRDPESAVKILWAFVQVLGQRLRKTTNELADALRRAREE
jgi:serine/threonine protein phosphatase PrpC